VKTAVKISVAIAALFVAAFATQADEDHIRWIKNGAPAETYITGGPWTLEQSEAAVGLKSAGYCDKSGIQIGNPGTQRMQPYYFPVINGHGNHLQGYFGQKIQMKRLRRHFRRRRFHLDLSAEGAGVEDDLPEPGAKGTGRRQRQQSRS